MSHSYLITTMVSLWCCLAATAMAEAKTTTKPTQQQAPLIAPVPYPLPTEDSAIAPLVRTWNQQPPKDTDDYEARRRQLYLLIATQKLTPEERQYADRLGILLEHNRRMHEANTTPETQQDLNHAIQKARRLQDFRQRFPYLKNPPKHLYLEQIVRDPFNLELEKALQDAIFIRCVSETWNVVASSDFTDFKPLAASSHIDDIKMIHMQTTIRQPSKNTEKLYLVFKGLPHQAVVDVDGVPQQRFPADARCSFRVNLHKRFPEQQTFTINIRISHPPQCFMPARTWIVQTETPRTVQRN